MSREHSSGMGDNKVTALEDDTPPRRYYEREPEESSTDVGKKGQGRKETVRGTGGAGERQPACQASRTNNRREDTSRRVADG